jgi:hypothetical protein
VNLVAQGISTKRESDELYKIHKKEKKAKKCPDRDPQGCPRCGKRPCRCKKPPNVEKDLEDYLAASGVKELEVNVVELTIADHRVGADVVTWGKANVWKEKSPDEEGYQYFVSFPLIFFLFQLLMNALEIVNLLGKIKDWWKAKKKKKENEDHRKLYKVVLSQELEGADAVMLSRCEDLEDYTVAQLKAICADKGLVTSFVKDDLVRRVLDDEFGVQRIYLQIRHSTLTTTTPTTPTPSAPQQQPAVPNPFQTGPTTPTTTPTTTLHNGTNVLCNCGGQVTVRRASNSANNPGRLWSRCPVCDKFRWHS